MINVSTLIEKAGGVSALARAVGVSHVSIIKWRRRNEVPVDRVDAVAAACSLRPADVRPDLAAMFAGEANNVSVTSNANG